MFYNNLAFSIISLFLSFIQCKKNTEKDEYEIANLILKRNITAFGIKIFPPKKILFGSIEHKKFNDSLINTGKLTYYLKPFFYKLDTLKYNVTFKSLEDYESTLFLIDTTGRKIDFSKIKIDNYKRVEKIPCRDKYLDNCNQYFVASFKLSEIIINKNNFWERVFVVVLPVFFFIIFKILFYSFVNPLVRNARIKNI